MNAIDGNTARYFSDNNAARTAELFIVEDPPEPNIRVGTRISTDGSFTSNGLRCALAFNTNTYSHLVEGQIYTLSY